MSKTVQYFTDDYLAQCRLMTPSQIGRFLEQFRLLHGSKASKRQLISIRIPQTLLETFKIKSQVHGTAYQTQIQRLMEEWLKK